ncbi:hypothetical protein KP803_14445 [Vibrio sp. ZSDE26]|uniref:C4-dicarboxylate ABC transporter n=1 Tax=Vibrio amylolyticus TaxID=2847292 RepID=A0A9X1XMZ2_9VIBR|nr:hypothetical protein [Vibrio amylolyticus]MCK6264478.1 hypothetical protein [Vibrio amylolyticus]
MSSNTLIRLPIALLSSSMGVAGLATAIQASQISIIEPLIVPIASIAALILIGMLISVLVRIVIKPSDIIDEVRVATKRNFLACLTITMFLLSGLMSGYESYSVTIWKVGVAIQIPLLVVIALCWISDIDKVMKELNPTFLIPPLACVVCSILSPAEYLHLSLLMYFTGAAIGIVIYITILLKTRQRKTPPTPLYPTFFIGLATPSMFLLGYLKITSEIGVGVIFMYAWAFFVFFALAMYRNEFMKVSFGVATWAFTFPLAAFTTATYSLDLLWIGHVLLMLTSAVVLTVAIKTVTHFQSILNH